MSHVHMVREQSFRQESGSERQSSRGRVVIINIESLDRLDAVPLSLEAAGWATDKSCSFVRV